MATMNRVANALAARRNHRTIATSAKNLPAVALAYSGLERSSLDLCGMRTSGSRRTSVNVVLPHFDKSQSFAGIATAMQFALGLAKRMGVPIRIIALQDRLSAPARRSSWAAAETQFGDFPFEVEVFDRADAQRMSVSADDIWIATYWTTAHALEVASVAGLVDPANVIYLVQDYEPGFYPWSSEYAVARSTYHAGFRLVVNSSPVARYLRTHEELAVSEDLVFRPQIDLSSADAARNSRRPGSRPRVFFYARPSKPRNLYTIGVAALQLASRSAHFDVVTAGEVHEPFSLASAGVVSRLGRLAWAEYFQVLGTVDTVFSLQQSPHPSHPPLDGLVAGANVVTNELGGSRANLLRPAHVADGTPRKLADALVQAVSAGPRGSAELGFLERLGRPLDHVLETVVDELAERGGAF